jgi:hypothetical protein
MDQQSDAIDQDLLGNPTHAALKKRDSKYKSGISPWSFPIIFLCWTICAIAWAASEFGWGTIGIAFYYGPIVNAVIAIVGLLLVSLGLPIRNSSRAVQCALIVISAFISSGLIFVAILLMPSGGGS